MNALIWLLQLSGLEPIPQSLFIQATGDGLERSLAKPRVRKEPATVEMLATLVGFRSLSDVRLAAICLLSFASFLRFDELAKLCCCDVKTSEASM